MQAYYKRGEMKHVSFVDVAIYLSFFPKFISGPIQRSKEFFSQIDILLSDKDMNFFDDYLLTSNDFDGVCHFLRQDSSDSTKVPFSTSLLADSIDSSNSFNKNGF